MKTNIFILHYAEDEHTTNCLMATLDPSNKVTGKIFVIDNGSPEPYKLPTAAPVKRVALIRYTENVFLIDAFNRAIQDNPADLYLCITCHSVPAKGSIPRLCDILSQDGVGIAAPGTNDWAGGILYVGGNPDPGQRDVETRHVDNCIWGFPQKLVDKIGLPDCEGHTHRACWASNADYCYRARQAGFKVIAARSAFYWHTKAGGQNPVALQAGRDWLTRKYGDWSIWN